VKRLLLVAALGALVLGATGCDLSPPAATVNGASISQSTLNATLNTIVSNASAQCATQLQAGLAAGAAGVGTEDDGSTPNAVTTAFAANVLESMIIEKLEQQTLAGRGVTVTAADLAAARTDYVGQLTEQVSQASSDSSTPSGCPLTTTGSVKTQLPASFLQQQALALADEEQFEVVAGHVDLSDAALRAYYQSHLSQVTQSCLNLLVATTQAGAQSLHDEIAAGTSFAAASKSAAVDQQTSPTGGELPCEYPSTVDSQVGTASVAATINGLATGQLAEPLALSSTDSSTGTTTTIYLVVQMRQHVLVPFANLASSIREVLLELHATAVKTALNRLLPRAQISVDARYGGWSTKHGITVPTPPEPAFVLNAGANVPVATGGGFHINLPQG
jgi:hypothetical protein